MGEREELGKRNQDGKGEEYTHWRHRGEGKEGEGYVKGKGFRKVEEQEKVKKQEKEETGESRRGRTMAKKNEREREELC